MLSYTNLLLLGAMIILFDFSKETSANSWNVVDDVVMGGRSNGGFRINDDGHGVFEGNVSLENNGGFSSIRHSVNNGDCAGKTHFVLRIKGDGKKYQFRVKSSRYDSHSYIYEFKTSGDWEVIEIPFNEMYPSFRGRKLRMPNFPGSSLQEMAFLIGNKKNESFQLLVDRIGLK